MLHSRWPSAASTPLHEPFALPKMEANEILVLVSGDAVGDARLAGLARIVGCYGVRIVGDVPVTMLADRLERQGRLDIVWLIGKSLAETRVVDCIIAEADRLAAAIVCEMDGPALDAAFADFAHLPGVQFLTNPDDVDCEMALAAARAGRNPRVADSGANVALQRIDQLQEEVARISAVLAVLAEREILHAPRAEPVSFSPMVRSAERGYRAEPELSAFGLTAPAAVTSSTVRRILRQRRMREQFFPAEMFADPAWDMLLDLYAAQLEGHPVAVSSLCIAAAVPATTALRWIKTMTDGGLFERQADPRDGRRIFIALAPGAAQGMERYFSAVAAMRD